MIKSAPRAAVEMGRYRDGKVLKEFLARYLVKAFFTWSHPESDWADLRPADVIAHALKSLASIDSA